jgi:hypothetical protein
VDLTNENEQIRLSEQDQEYLHEHENESVANLAKLRTKISYGLKVYHMLQM